jgi:hypothetical protein
MLVVQRIDIDGIKTTNTTTNTTNTNTTQLILILARSGRLKESSGAISDAQSSSSLSLPLFIISVQLAFLFDRPEKHYCLCCISMALSPTVPRNNPSDVIANLEERLLYVRRGTDLHLLAAHCSHASNCCCGC